MAQCASTVGVHDPSSALRESSLSRAAFVVVAVLVKAHDTHCTPLSLA